MTGFNIIFVYFAPLITLCLANNPLIVDPSTITKNGLPFNPDVELSTIEIIRRHGYPAEAHTVTTEDGYLITMHRIPCGRICNGTRGRGQGQPVLLQHGLFCSSAVWVISGPENGLAFILADAGYDVWLGNLRGSIYSKGHINLSNLPQSSYWNFSWHEMGKYDIAAEIDWIYDIKSEEGYRSYNPNDLIYIGHSLGTTTLSVLLSTRPEYNQKIALGLLLAPTMYMAGVRGPVRVVATFAPHLEAIRWLLGGNEFAPSGPLMRVLSLANCAIARTNEFICKNILFIFAGFSEDQFNRTVLPAIVGHTPAGTSTKTVIHFLEMISSGGRFQEFDFGERKNLNFYGQTIPPEYDITKITAPLGFYYAKNDILADPRDVLRAFSEIGTPVQAIEIPHPNFNHLDYLWGKDVRNLLYVPMMRLMANYN